MTLVPYLKRYKRAIITGIIFIILTNIFNSISPKVLGLAIDSIRNQVSWRSLGGYAGIIVLVACIQGYFRYQMRLILIGFSRIAEYDLRNEIFAHLQTQPAEYYHRNKTGDLMARLTNDLNAVRMVLGPGIMYTLNTLILFVIVVSLMLWVNVKLTLLAFIPFPVLTYLVSRSGKIIYTHFERVQETFSDITTKAQENIAGIRVVKAYTRESSEIEYFKTLNREYVSRNRKLIRLWSLFFPMMQLLSGLGMAIVLWVGGSQVIKGIITLGDFVAFNTYLAMLVWPVISLGWVINIFQRGAASMGRINQIFDDRPKTLAGDNEEQLTAIKGQITISNLTFAYSSERGEVLRDINLHIEAGSSIAIVGPLGCGKSTLVNLLCRIYDPPPETIFIDGIDIRRIPLKVLREHIGYVPQETFLFSDTIRENIIYGRESAADHEISKAAEIAQVRETVEEFPNKYETILGERGINLSGGQKQRVAIARAIVRDPRILILDDALSSVDTYTEEQILRRLPEVMQDRTTILISHRVSTVKNADVIIVLDKGGIIEKGSHEELLNLNGIYANLYQKQLLAEEIEAEENGSNERKGKEDF